MLSRLLAGLRRSPSRLESGVGVLLPSPAVLEQLRPHMPTMDGNPRNAAELVRTAVGKLCALRKSDICAEQHCDAVRLDDNRRQFLRADGGGQRCNRQPEGPGPEAGK